MGSWSHAGYKTEPGEEEGGIQEVVHISARASLCTESQPMPRDRLMTSQVAAPSRHEGTTAAAAAGSAEAAAARSCPC